MSELDKLIENYFAPRPKTLTKQMLYEMFDEVLGEVGLTKKHLLKRQNVEVFIKKIQSQAAPLPQPDLTTGPFTQKTGGYHTPLTGKFKAKTSKGVIKGSLVTTDTPDDEYPFTSESDFGAILDDTSRLDLEDNDGSWIPSGNLHKSKPFGSRDCTRKEIQAMNALKKEVATAITAAGPDADAIVVNLVDFKTGEIIGIYDDVTGVEQTGKVGGTDAKSDFALVRKGGKPSIYISHKWGAKPPDFGQWSGVTKKAGERIHKHKEVQAFIDQLKLTEYVTELKQPKKAKGGQILTHEYHKGKSSRSVGKKILREDLKNLAVFGNAYQPTGDGGVENVDVVAQGNITLQTCTDGSFYLTAPHMMLRQSAGRQMEKWDSTYEPALVTRFATGRSNFAIDGLRMTIYPFAGRKVDTWLDPTAEELAAYAEELAAQKASDEEV